MGRSRGESSLGLSTTPATAKTLAALRLSPRRMSVSVERVMMKIGEYCRDRVRVAAEAKWVDTKAIRLEERSIGRPSSAAGRRNRSLRCRCRAGQQSDMAEIGRSMATELRSRSHSAKAHCSRVSMSMA